MCYLYGSRRHLHEEGGPIGFGFLRENAFSGTTEDTENRIEIYDERGRRVKGRDGGVPGKHLKTAEGGVGGGVEEPCEGKGNAFEVRYYLVTELLN